MDLKQLYQDIILDHGKSPRNFGKCVGYNSEAKGYNPLCGDLVQIYLKLNVEKKVEDLTFEGNGCAISMASASIMTDLVKGKSSEVAKKIIDAFLKMIKSSTEMKSNDAENPIRWQNGSQAQSSDPATLRWTSTGCLIMYGSIQEKK